MKIYLANRLVSISNEIISMFPATLKGQENEKVSQESQATILNSLGNMTRELEALGLPFTKLAAGRFAMDLPNMKGDDCEKAFDDLNQRFQDEVGNIRFFYVSPNKMAYFDQSSAFGPQVLELVAKVTEGGGRNLFLSILHFVLVRLAALVWNPWDARPYAP